jgi:hypothetical protein
VLGLGVAWAVAQAADRLDPAPAEAVSPST